MLLLHDVQAAPVREARRVGVHQRHVSRHRRPRDPRAPRGAVRDRSRRHRRGGRVPRRVRRCALAAGELRVPRAACRPSSAVEIVEEYRSGARRARTVSGSTALPERRVTATETRIVTKRLHDRPDDSWTIDGALACGAYDVAARGAREGRPRRRAGAGEAVGPARPRRRRLPDRAEVVVPAAPTPSRAISWSTPTRASRRRSRTACSSSAIRTSSSRASRSRRTRSSATSRSSTCAASSRSATSG